MNRFIQSKIIEKSQVWKCHCCCRNLWQLGHLGVLRLLLLAAQEEEGRGGEEEAGGEEEGEGEERGEDRVGKSTLL